MILCMQFSWNLSIIIISEGWKIVKMELSGIVTTGIYINRQYALCRIVFIYIKNILDTRINENTMNINCFNWFGDYFILYNIFPPIYYLYQIRPLFLKRTLNGTLFSPKTKNHTVLRCMRQPIRLIYCT